ncbi:alpha/beta fold hydrolase [Nocardioides humilatus]|uniref:Alpha/beta fold hydrolase n=1 Tax=Nocardioides humilatus TaxID=2607660 RepID=A0A5B1LEF6_9ACTN|nr:AMP-binding protein [Nocardioides humilatus]KAA1419093.1 alpha/beta fold hydrolase [Nocardioides humilatus]
MAGPLGRITRHTQNLLEVARYGGLRTGELPSEFEIADRGVHHRLRRYVTDLPADAPAIVLVPPLMVSSEVFDVSPQASAVRTLAAGGVQPWVVDFGSPEHEPGGLDRTIEDHVLAVDQAVDFVRKETGRPVHLAGYSQGGMFCYQVAAYRRSKDIASITVYGSPVDMHGSTPFKVPAPVAQTGARLLSGTANRYSLPGWMTRTGFRALDPIGAVTGQISFLWALHDREALLPREGQRQFLMRDGWVAFPGPSLAYVLEQFVLHNRMLSGGFSVAGRAVSLADIDVPVLTIVGEVDEIAPAATVRAIRQAAPRAEVYELSMRAGHFGLVVGSAAIARTWPATAAWVKWREGQGELPEEAVAVPETEASPAPRERLEHNLELAGSIAELTARRIAEEAAHPVRRIQRLFTPAAQIPRVARAVGLRGSTHESLATVFDRRAAHASETVGFLFEGLVYDYGVINDRVDRIVRGLIIDGVEPGDRVGVLMATRPTALALIVALNRIGAVAVLLRPDGDSAREAALGEVSRVYTDPAHEALRPAGIPGKAFILRGGAESADGVNDLEVKEQDAPPLPKWYRRNPGRADDLAFVFFTGHRARTRMVRVTNGRWALTAYGTASSAQLSDRDTLFSVSPLHHPAGLLTAIGGAIVGGSRIAMLSDLEPETFWAEARRYGVTAVSYTWTQLNALVEAAPNPAERDHTIRLFFGSGLPRGLWRRVTERFAPAGVLEMWGSSEIGAIMGNVSGTKIGAVGRPLPGSAKIRLARFDLETGEIARDASGFAIPAAAGELGLLMASDKATVRDLDAQTDVFAPGDSWHATASLFRRDADGDYWLEGVVEEIIQTVAGPVLPAPVGAVFEELPNVTSAVAYPLTDASGTDVVVVALSARKDVGAAALTAAAWRLPAQTRPAIVHLVDEMPLSSAGRPAGTVIRSAGVTGPAWRYDPKRDEYRPMTKAALAKLAATPPA